MKQYMVLLLVMSCGALFAQNDIEPSRIKNRGYTISCLEAIYREVIDVGVEKYCDGKKVLALDNVKVFADSVVGVKTYQFNEFRRDIVVEKPEYVGIEITISKNDLLTTNSCWLSFRYLVAVLNKDCQFTDYPVCGGKMTILFTVDEEIVISAQVYGPQFFAKVKEYNRRMA